MNKMLEDQMQIVSPLQSSFLPFFMFLVLTPNLNVELPRNFRFPDYILYIVYLLEALLFKYSTDCLKLSRWKAI